MCENELNTCLAHVIIYIAKIGRDGGREGRRGGGTGLLDEVP